MTNLEYLICPKDHAVPYTRENYARDFSDGDVDVLTLEKLYESGLYCSQCKRAYGLNKLKEPNSH